MAQRERRNTIAIGDLQGSMPETKEVFQGAVLYLPQEKEVEELAKMRVLAQKELHNDFPVKRIAGSSATLQRVKIEPWNHPIVVLSRPQNDSDMISFVMMTTVKPSSSQQQFAHIHDYIAVDPTSPISPSSVPAYAPTVTQLQYCNGYSTKRKGYVCVDPVYWTNRRNCLRWKSRDVEGGWALDAQSTALVLDRVRRRCQYMPSDRQFKPGLDNRAELAQGVHKNHAYRGNALKSSGPVYRHSTPYPRLSQPQIYAQLQGWAMTFQPCLTSLHRKRGSIGPPIIRQESSQG
ncbi:hypothetical protein Slin15195_G116540 [Septoria linicola]|uniref:Uncharacterized protein n=1 Tax=Septoria linicola TaxID=215465 RepID=A0A9Q9EPQ8_9PEZI|nr:hypothetical protein Slin15195_G116540 [Septoria linicola]